MLEAAEDAGVEIPLNALRNLRTVQDPASGWPVTMAVPRALTVADRAKGLILACQAHALRDVEVDA